MRFSLIKKPVIFGSGAGIVLLALYFLILSLANSFSHAISQFSQMWYWILILVIGFGLQVGLYFYIRESQRKVSSKILATSGSISSGSMIVCCLHHLVDVLPIMGLVTVALFLIKYQILFIVVGILSNLIGITLMLEVIQKQELASGFLKKILIVDMNLAKKMTISSSLILLPIAFFLINPNQTPQPKVIDLPAKTNNQAGVLFTATPLGFSFDEPAKFEIKIDTHSGSLDLDLTRIAILEDDKEDQYQPLDWQSSSESDHHLASVLLFPKINNQARKIKLIIKGAGQRVFEWDLK